MWQVCGKGKISCGLLALILSLSSFFLSVCENNFSNASLISQRITCLKDGFLAHAKRAYRTLILFKDTPLI